MKQVPGRKTDVCDAEWICKLMSFGLLKRSYIPVVEQRDLRDLTRYRRRLVEERTSASNRLEKILEDSNIKLSFVPLLAKMVVLDYTNRKLPFGVCDVRQSSA
ncbi:MAG TPA: transposase [Anaerolineae bacterium]|nr:transposase [Anaerolineae bacterium]